MKTADIVKGLEAILDAKSVHLSLRQRAFVEEAVARLERLQAVCEGAHCPGCDAPGCRGIE